tara:strand:- start:379 stop:897 length:519 start_codon:yes stop_codon:yes gene_type:complete
MKDLAHVIARNRLKKGRKKPDEGRLKPRPKRDIGTRFRPPKKKAPEGPKVGKRAQRIVESVPHATTEAEGKLHSVYSVPDTWKKAPGAARLPPPQPDRLADGNPTIKEKRKKPFGGRPPAYGDKARKHQVALAVTIPEREALYDYAASQGLAFSQWARSVLFAAASISLKRK